VLVAVARWAFLSQKLKEGSSMNKTALAALLAMAMTAAASAQESTRISFETADKNGDGRVNREEASVVAGFDFSRADANLDASLSRPEYQAAMSAPSPSGEKEKTPRSREPAAHVSFETTDKNTDGRVNRQEASDIPGFDFAAADTDEDATLNRQEFRVALATFLPRG
jgi:Ca2+-binding EF-hand superfamily protein